MCLSGTGPAQRLPKAQRFDRHWQQACRVTPRGCYRTFKYFKLAEKPGTEEAPIKLYGQRTGTQPARATRKRMGSRELAAGVYVIQKQE